MKKSSRIPVYALLCTLLIISWFIVVNSKSITEKQLILIEQAKVLKNDGVYIRAVPLLEEAAGYNAAYTIYAENELKETYLALVDNRGYSRRYVTLLEKQMNRPDAESYIFIEAANYYLGLLKTQEALTVLRNGVEKTGAPEIIALYEDSRYVYEINNASYEYVTAIYENTVQVRHNNIWGIAGTDGIIMIPCEYDKISTFARDRAIVSKNNNIYAVDRNNNRIAVIHENIYDIGNFAQNRIPLLTESGWCRATGEFELGKSIFDEIGMYSDGYAAARTNGKWGVIDISDGWLISAEYDDIIRDELGRCYAQNSVFARKGDDVYLFENGDLTGAVYEDARPFTAEGYAAVMRNGKWGFIDTGGNEVINFVFDNALSFGQHLAAVKIGELWGYISLNGNVVIEPVFYEAKSFSGGSAPVLTDRGWQLITLLEYKKGVSL